MSNDKSLYHPGEYG